MEELKKIELVPFQAAFDAGIDMVMTAHIVFPQIDAKYPATLSEAILTGLIRDEMNYDGVVITDAMNMAAISANYTEVESTILAISAGADIVLMPTILRSNADLKNKLIPLVDGLVAEADSNPEFMARVEASVKRVLQMKENRGILDYQTGDVESKVNNALSTVGSDENRALERQIAKDAVVVVKNDENTLPFNLQSGDKVVAFGAYTSRTRGIEFSVKRLNAEGVIPEDVVVETHLLVSGTTPISKESTEAIIADADYVIIISETGNANGLKEGAQGLIIPNVHTVEEVKKVVSYGKYFPMGNRGVAPTSGSAFWTADYATQGLDHYFEVSNRETLIIPQCETRGALENIEEIVAIEGVDGIFVGPYDLSTALGKPGQFSDPEVSGGIQRVLDACKAAGKYSFIYAGNFDAIIKNFEMGYDSITYGMDVITLIEAVKQTVKDVKETIK